MKRIKKKIYMTAFNYYMANVDNVKYDSESCIMNVQ